VIDSALRAPCAVAHMHSTADATCGEESANIIARASEASSDRIQVRDLVMTGVDAFLWA
jgi:hypothetical protein